LYFPTYFKKSSYFITLPTPIPAAWILFILTTPVFFYSGWIFLYSTYQALRRKTLNMAVLIAVGITAAYVFSVLLTLLGGSDSYYEAGTRKRIITNQSFCEKIYFINWVV